MKTCTRILVISTLITASKAHHFIRVVILAGLGLAGLWMVHTLAQDWNNISGSHGGPGGAAGGGKGFDSSLFLEKRSLDNKQPPEINWDFVISRDPASCARSFICQLAAQDEVTLDDTERSILDLTRISAQRDSWAGKQLLEALKYGEKLERPGQCMKVYKLCPYTSQTMMRLLRIFGG